MHSESIRKVYLECMSICMYLRVCKYISFLVLNSAIQLFLNHPLCLYNIHRYVSIHEVSDTFLYIYNICRYVFIIVMPPKPLFNNTITMFSSYFGSVGTSASLTTPAKRHPCNVGWSLLQSGFLFF